MLKILVVLPMYGGSLPIGRYCVKALQSLGHSVRVFNAPNLYPGYEGFQQLDLTPARISQLENAFLRVVCQALWAQAEEQKPDLVLALAQAPIDHITLQKMRQAGMRTVMWFVEDFRLFTYWQTFAPLYDAFAVIQKQPFLEKLAAIGQKHGFYLPLAALPDFHQHKNLTKEEQDEYGSDIAFLGAGYPNRRLAFRPLAAKNFKIWGSDWDGETVLAHNIQRNGQRITEEESVLIYNAAKINLNLHSSVEPGQLIGNGDFVNPRTFELAAMGAFQLVDHRDLLSELFAENELVTFATLEEFYSKIDYFLQHPEERKIYAERAQKRVLAEHTYEQRMAALVAYMENAFGPWPGKNEAEAFPADKREQLCALALKLGLSENAGLDDIIAKLRRQGARLNAQEVALIFGDEWKKQYGK